MSDVEVAIQLLFAVVCSGGFVFGIYRWGSIREGYGIADEWDRMADDLAGSGGSVKLARSFRELAADKRAETRRFARWPLPVKRYSVWRGLWERVLQREGREGR